MSSIKYRLRSRKNLTQKEDIIDLTDDAIITTSKFIEIIDLTGEHTRVDPERLADFRNRIQLAFRKLKKQSIMRLTRRVNLRNAQHFSKSEIDSMLLQMADDKEISLSNGLVHLMSR